MTRLRVWKSALSVCLIVLLVLLACPQTARASSLVVNTYDDIDDGSCSPQHCSLREAIIAANANPGPDIITFDVPEGGSNIIRVTSPLPALTDDATTIDATTLSHYNGAPVVYLGKDVAVVETGLLLESNNNIIRGLGFAGFGEWPSLPGDLLGAIVITGSNNTIELSTIGLGAGWNSTGVRLAGASNNILNNVVSGNENAIYADAPNQIIQGNMIGVDWDGATAIYNGNGIVLWYGADNTLIGGSAPGEGNVISANNNIGLSSDAEGITIYGNRIGTDVSGATAVPNGLHGMVVRGGYTQIGGGAPGQENVISGNGICGIWINDDNNVIQGNYIGTDSTGTMLIPNGSCGIETEANPSITIGGSSPDLGNIIMGNGSQGIWIDDLANGSFVANNIIAQNGGHGIDLTEGVNNNTITQNSIYDNGGLGIDIDSFMNETNGGIEPPALSGGLGLGISGTACPYCIIEFFIADPDPSGAGEGKTFLDVGYANGNGDFNVSLSGVGFCQQITATATDGAGNTSEFSDNIYANCFYFPPLYLYPIWAFTIVVFGILAWIVRRYRPDPRRSILFGAVGGGLLFLVLIMGLPFVRPEFTNPPECGNGVVESGETCDGNDLSLCRNDQVCENCSCVTVIEEPGCGNGIRESGEQCDGDDLSLCRDDQVCEDCRCVTPMEAENPSEGCFYEALSNTYCRQSDYRESDPVAIVTAGESALLVGLNPQYTHGLFELESGDRCWMWFNTLEGPENPLGTCGVQLVDPPEAPEEVVCRSDLDEAACVAAGGEWVVGMAPLCRCP